MLVSDFIISFRFMSSSAELLIKKTPSLVVLCICLLKIDDFREINRVEIPLSPKASLKVCHRAGQAKDT